MSTSDGRAEGTGAENPDEAAGAESAKEARREVRVQVVALPTPEVKNTQGIVTFLEETLTRAKAGSFNGLLVILDGGEGSYEYTRLGFGLERAIGLHQRAVHKLNLEWDKP